MQPICKIFAPKSKLLRKILANMHFLLYLCSVKRKKTGVLLFLYIFQDEFYIIIYAIRYAETRAYDARTIDRGS